VSRGSAQGGEGGELMGADEAVKVMDHMIAEVGLVIGPPEYWDLVAWMKPQKSAQ
jgi:hypothetical protein